MSKLKFLGDLVHTEKYTKDGEEKKAYKNGGGLFQRDDGSYVVKQFDTWFNVYPPKTDQPKQQESSGYPDDLDDELPPF